MATKKRVFISFDAEHDEELKNLLIGQAKNEDSPFSLADWSVKEPLTGDWKEKIKPRIRSCELMIVICGEYTDTASGVNAELKIAREESLPYFLLWGRSSKDCKKPTAAQYSDKVYKWTWDNLKALISGAR